MGYAKDRGLERRSKGKAGRASGSSSWGKRGDGDLSGCLADVPGLAAVLDRITAAGAALIVARTSDGGAYALTLLDGDSRAKRYAHTQGELDEAFADLSVEFAEVPTDA